MISGALAQAIHHEMLERNVALNAEPPAVPAKQTRPPTIEELTQLLEAADDDFRVFLFVALTTGARRGELAALRGLLADGSFLGSPSGWTVSLDTQVCSLIARSIVPDRRDSNLATPSCHVSSDQIVMTRGTASRIRLASNATACSLMPTSVHSR